MVYSLTNQKRQPRYDYAHYGYYIDYHRGLPDFWRGRSILGTRPFGDAGFLSGDFQE